MAFYNSIDNLQNVVISFTQNPINDFGVFARGYCNAAKILSEEFLNSPHSRGDYNGYPIVFLYRHAFELYLKGVIYKGFNLANIMNLSGINEKLYNVHELDTLAIAAKDILAQVFPNNQSISSLSKQIVQISDEFQQIDPSSFSYRYPISRNGKHSTNPHQIVNIEAVHLTMTSLLDELEVLNFGFDVTIDTIELTPVLKNLIGADQINT